MKNLLLIVLLLFSFKSFSQYSEATLYLRDGTTLEGFAKVWTESSLIRFKKTKKQKQKPYDFRKVKKIIIREGDKNNQYEYKIVKVRNGSKPKLLEFIEFGKVSLYRTALQQTLGVSGPIQLNTASYDYYLARNNSDYADHIGSRSIDIGRKSLKKGMLKYFNDCPDLITKIENEEFKNKEILDIVRFYNSNCSNN